MSEKNIGLLIIIGAVLIALFMIIAGVLFIVETAAMLSLAAMVVTMIQSMPAWSLLGHAALHAAFHLRLTIRIYKHTHPDDTNTT